MALYSASTIISFHVINSIGYTLSRLRRGIKAGQPDAFITDRYLYSLFTKHASVLMRRQDAVNKLMKFNSVFQELMAYPCVQVDRSQLPPGLGFSGESITRTRDPLPAMHEGYFGPLLRTVGSLDGSLDLNPTYPATHKNARNRSDARYNFKKYYWYMDGYLYLPDVQWRAVRIEGVFEGNIDYINQGVVNCVPMHQQRCNIPEFLYSEIEQLVRQELAGLPSLPADPAQDNQSLLR